MTKVLLVIPSCIRLPFFCLVALFLIFSHANSQSQSQSQLHDQEHQVLLKIKQYLQDPPFLSHWTKSNSSHCSWPEITCTNGSVTGLALVNFNINQTIPTFICDLKNLTHVDFNLNFIPGGFPTSLYNCSKLEYLDLSMNNFDGIVPDDIDRLSNLRYLNISYTNFTGDIPLSVGNLKELRFLAFQDCLFNGTFPDEIGNLLNLETLDLSGNSILPPSRIPSSWTKLKKVKIFYMYQCNLIGGIPETIGDMVALEELDLSQNKLTGQIPSSLFKLRNLSIIRIWKNGLSGEIPSVVEALNLTIIDLTRNSIKGKIPDDFGKLENLTSLRLSINNLSDVIPESLGRLPLLVDFRAFMNNLSGTLPPEFGRYSKLEVIHTASNNLIGRLPENICYNSALINLTVYGNNLNGELPRSLGNCSTLQDLKIYNNQFSGKIPISLWTFPNLVNFMVSNNRFTGELPDRLSLSVSSFQISYNQFSGRIPSGVSSWTNVVVFDASSNFLNGSIPQELTSLPKLTRLLLDQNQLTGSFPMEITSWKLLVTLNVSRNKLSGQIPTAIGRLPVLGVLDLSENQFSGQIPSLPSTRLNNLNLSSNHLTGRVPSEFENSGYDTSFLNNPGLCADTPALNIALCNSASKSSSNKDSSFSPALIISLSVVASLLAILISFLIIRFRRKRKQVLDNSWKLTAFQRLNFTESDIVSSLEEHNIIGSGGYGAVYRVEINGLGYVAVKRIYDNSRKLDKNLEGSFVAEVKILSSIRHKNIVKLLCCIHNNETMLLVYEYLENRSLDKWLHKKIKSSSSVSGSVHHVALNWPMRMQIAIGVAQGLSYMHHDCSPPVVHRDVKTSNILLDSQFNAKVADFGLARMLIKPGELATVSAIVGSFGYVAPEYIQTTRVSEKIDVFSFGVILLEMTTGKEANYGDEHLSLAEWAWSQFQVGRSIEEMLDKQVMEQCYMDEMCQVFKLGVMCTAKLPSARPTMKEALQILLRSGEAYAFVESNVVGHYDFVPLLRESKREHRVDVDGDS